MLKSVASPVPKVVELVNFEHYGMLIDSGAQQNK